MDYFNMVVADIHGIRPAELVAFQKKGGKVVVSVFTCRTKCSLPEVPLRDFRIFTLNRIIRKAMPVSLLQE